MKVLPVDPSKRFITIVLAAGAAVLVVAILVGQRMGDRVLGAASSSGPAAMPIVSPAATATAQSYGPDWKRSQTLAAAVDPGFPDPRVPPKPVPTVPPTPKPTERPKLPPTPTPNPNLPVWDQAPFRRMTASPQASGEPPSPPPSGGPASSNPGPRQDGATPHP